MRWGKVRDVVPVGEKPETKYALGIETKIMPKAGFWLNLLGRGAPIVGEQFLLTTKLINLGSEIIPELGGKLEVKVNWGGPVGSSIGPLSIPKLEPDETPAFKNVLVPPKSGGVWVDYTTSSTVLELWKAYGLNEKYDLVGPGSNDIQFIFYIKSKEEIAQMILIWLTSALILVAVAQILLLII